MDWEIYFIIPPHPLEELFSGSHDRDMKPSEDYYKTMNARLHRFYRFPYVIGGKVVLEIGKMKKLITITEEDVVKGNVLYYD